MVTDAEYYDSNAALFDESGVMVLDYDPSINRFRDEMGSVINDIYRHVRPTDIMVFRKNKGVHIVSDRTNNFLVRMVYPDEELLDLEY
jgi:hypothetical protein